MSGQSIAISHAVDLAAYSNSVVRKMLRILSLTDGDLFDSLLRAINRTPVSAFQLERFIVLLKSAREINAAAYARMGKVLAEDMGLLAAYEAEFAQTTLRALGARAVPAISPTQIAAAAVEQPLRGRLMAQWASSLGQTRMQRVQDAIAIAYGEGRSIDEITRLLRGTRAAGFRDGLLRMTRQDTANVVRTAVGHYAAASRELMFKASASEIELLTWLSTLDHRTSEDCRLRDGLEYTVDGEPIGHDIPWRGGPGRIHWSCRSTAVPKMKGSDFVPAKRASMDGPVSGKLTYAKWLKLQPAARQNEILGPNRGRLFRAGRYTLDRFYNNEGRYLTLAELRKADAATFARLGL